MIDDGLTTSNVVTVTIDVESAAGPPSKPPPDNENPAPDDDSPPPEDDTETNDGPSAPTIVGPQIRNNVSGGDTQRDASSMGDDELAVDLAAGQTVSLNVLSGVENFVFFQTADEDISEKVKEAIRAAVPQLVGYLDPLLFWERLDEFQAELDPNSQILKFTVGSVAVASLGVTVGYVIWTIKGGYLLASVLSTLPAWRFMDPLPIFDAAAAGTWQFDEDDEETEELNIE